MTEFNTEEPFPLISDKIKELEQQLSDASWNNNQEEFSKIKLELNEWRRYIDYGERYIIPF